MKKTVVYQIGKRIFVKKKLLIILIFLLLCLAFLQLDFPSLLSSINQIPLWLIVLLLILQIISQLLFTTQWYQMGKLANIQISFWDMFYINCQGSVVDATGVRIGGEITRAVKISHIGNCSGEKAASVVALQKLFSLSAFFFICLFATGYLINEVPLLQALSVQLFVYSVLFSFLLLIFSIFVIPHRIKSYLELKPQPRFSWMSKVKFFLLSLLDPMISLQKNKKQWMMYFLLAIIIWSVYPVKMYLLTIPFSSNVHFFSVVAIAFFSYMVALIPIFPGGLGGFEATMSGLLLAIGFINHDALIITILFRFVTFWLVTIISLIFITYYKAKHSISPIKEVDNSEKK